MSIGVMTVEVMSVGEITVGVMSRPHKNNFRYTCPKSKI